MFFEYVPFHSVPKSQQGFIQISIIPMLPNNWILKETDSHIWQVKLPMAVLSLFVVVLILLLTDLSSELFLSYSTLTS